jgi:short-subunit dehydrogenase
MIVITGASDGLGKELAKLLVTAGKQVINLSRQDSATASRTIAMDLTDESSIVAAAAEILGESEPIEALINCAGVMSLEAIDKLTSAEIERTFKVNVTGPMLLVSQLASRIKQDKADIINVASTVGTKAYKDQAAYGSSKWAMRGFSQNLQLEFKDSETRVISFCVGGFNSRIAEKVTGQPTPDPENWMDPAEVAKFMKQILDLPKNMEVSEIIINRKSIA